MATNEDICWNTFLPAFLDRLYSAMRKNIDSIVSDQGLTASHAAYLVGLKAHNGQTLIELSNYLDLDPANTNRIIKTLRDKELIFDDREKKSSKKYNVYLTDSGKELATKIVDGLNEQNYSYFNGIPREDVLVMRNALIKVFRNIKQNEEGTEKKYDAFYMRMHLYPSEEDCMVDNRRAANLAKRNG